ncbi:MAG: 5-(carboxyamino)imidazole ribonucleotide synthase [Planctomycetota bacterium]
MSGARAAKVVGVLGGGQLGRMLAQAGAGAGVEVRCFDEAPDACAGQVCPLTVGSFEDHDAVLAFARSVDAVTYEFENVPVDAVRVIEDAGLVVQPSSRSLEVAQDRLRERELFARLGIESPRWWAVETLADVERAWLGCKGGLVLKTRRMGYDGKGQAVIKEADEVSSAHLAIERAPAIADELVPFDAEVSCVLVRTAEGETAAWPVGRNAHARGILRESVVPSGCAPEVESAAIDAAGNVAEALGHVGVLAVEFFVVGDRLLANEIAPRVHNTGHWTIEGARTSQFENHLRAVAGLPIGETGFAEGIGAAAMVNMIGGMPELESAHGMTLHGYGKSARPGRKVGHATVVGADAATVSVGLESARALGEVALDLGRAAEVGL